MKISSTASSLVFLAWLGATAPAAALEEDPYPASELMSDCRAVNPDGPWTFNTGLCLGITQALAPHCNGTSALTVGQIIGFLVKDIEAAPELWKKNGPTIAAFLMNKRFGCSWAR